MIRIKLGLAGLCVAILGLMAFSVSGAHAEGTWLVLTAGGQVKTGTELPGILEFEKDSSNTLLHSSVLTIPVLWVCTGVKSILSKIFGTGAIGKGVGEEKGSKILYSGCSTLLKGVEAPECTPKDASGGAGEIVTKPVHALVNLFELAGGARDDIVRFLPDEGETFATIEMSAACPIGTKVPILGELALKDGENLSLTHLVKHLLEPFEPSTKLWVISKTAEHVVAALGSIWAFLGGEHTGLKWGISGV